MKESSAIGTPTELNWSRTYWAVLINQLLVVAMLTFVATGLLRESYRASAAAELRCQRSVDGTFRLGLRD